MEYQINEQKNTVTVIEHDGWSKTYFETITARKIRKGGKCENCGQANQLSPLWQVGGHEPEIIISWTCCE